MYFCITCLDKPDSMAIRMANREAHLAGLKPTANKILAAGPLLSDDGQSMVGSVLIIDFADKAAAEDFARNDPYAMAGLFASVSVRPWRKVYPAD